MWLLFVVLYWYVVGFEKMNKVIYVDIKEIYMYYLRVININ